MNCTGFHASAPCLACVCSNRSRKGVSVTTGGFTNKAREDVSHIDPRVVLIDGRALAEYMVDHDVGVTTKATNELKRIESDYFSEDE